LGHDDPTVIKQLEDLTGEEAASIPLNDKQTMAIFSSVEPLEVKPDDIGTSVGTYGIPEFGTRFVRQMLEATRPTTFSELVRISGLSHGTDVWLNNAQTLIEGEIASLNEVICTRDDIMIYLIQQGIEKNRAFQIMENVRKGKGLNSNQIDIMQESQVPSWYIES
ncbi:MAG TPA: PolC-type DNA polymerase III, partial [Syntrophomonas sp.]|nr:PolC-type DNA polymerase III [Syntrophomonas sp.]